MRGLVIAASIAFNTTAFSQTYLTPSGPANGKTCSQLAKECHDRNYAVNADTGRCPRYKAACLKTGIYTDRMRTVTGVAKR